MTEDALPGRIAVVDEGGRPVIRLSGEIDTLVVEAYERHLPGACGRPPAVIDASEVTFLDGRGLRFLVRTTRAARRAGAHPVLRSPARVVRRVVDLTGSAGTFTITL
jgi:anti-anti-sigma factor